MLEVSHISKTFNAGTVNEKRAISDLSLRLADGEFATIVGSNGAGKSTLFNAIAGVFYVDAGTITLDGRDITFLPSYQRSRRIGHLFQDPLKGTAPHMTIEENLALAARRGQSRSLRPGITRAEREQYRELLKILDLGLEDRLTSKVGLLSGGQRQRLSIARALVKDAGVLLFDDSFSALDVKTDAALRRALREQVVRPAKLIVAQRVSTILDADLILVLDEGRLVGAGTHGELLETCPVYRAIADSQMQREGA